ncbi:MAG: murein biosynthesis integral membrane protein MurJ [Parcubacteria group bacterium]|nr:murein biosynthesis integral membrane protein MurJ [Parcubacteria group bacterium]
MLKKIFSFKTNIITSSAFILGASILISRILGIFRDRLLASEFGAGDALDIYYASFQIPDFIYNLIVAGIFSAAFLPIFVDYWLKDKNEAWRLTNIVINVLAGILIIVSLILSLLAPVIMPVFFPGFSAQKIQAVVKLSRIMFLSPFFLGLSAILSAVLHSLKKFLVYGLAPIFYNAGIIIGIVFFFPLFGLSGLAWGVVLGAFLHFFIQAPVLFRAGFKPKLIFNFQDHGLKKIVLLTIPRSLTLAANQINLLFIAAFASTLSAGSLAVFNFAHNLQSIPIGLFGLSFALSAFPDLAALSSKEAKEEFHKYLFDVILKIFFFVIPISVLIFVFRAQIVRVVLGAGEFGWRETRLVAASLGVLSLSVFAQSLLTLLARAFYALKDSLTPFLARIVAVIVNILLTFIFFRFFKEKAFLNFLSSLLKLNSLPDIGIVLLALAFAIGEIAGIVFLWIMFSKKYGHFHPDYIFPIFKILLVSLAAGGLGWLALRPLNLIFDTTRFWGIFFQTFFAASIAIIFYLIFTRKENPLL